MRTEPAGATPAASSPLPSEPLGRALAEAVIPLGVLAPSAARDVVARCLDGRVAAPVLSAAELLASELVTNSVRHSGAPPGLDVLVRVHLSREACRLEVSDRGCGAPFGPRRPELRAAASGLGLNLLRMLSERWGIDRSDDAPTLVWAQLAREPRAPL